MRYTRPTAFKRMQEIVSELREDSNLSTKGFTEDKRDYTSGFYLGKNKNDDGLFFREGPSDSDPAYKGFDSAEMERFAAKNNFCEGDCVAVYFSMHPSNDIPVALYITLIYNADVHNLSIIDRLDHFKPDPDFQSVHPPIPEWNAPVWF